MADQFNIEVRDNVAPTIKSKLEDIAKQALSAADNVERLQRLLDTVSGNKLAGSQGGLADQASKTANAYLQQETALNKAIVAENNAAASAARLAQAQAQAAQAATNSATATQRLDAATSRAQAASVGTATAQQRLAQATTQAATAQTQATTAATLGATAQQRLAASTSQAQAAADRAALAALKLKEAQNGSGGSGGGPAPLSEGLLNSITSFAARIGIAYAAYRAFKELISTADAYTNLQNKLRQVADNQSQVNALTVELLNVANRSRAPLDATATTFTRINQAIKGYGGSQAEALHITEALTKSTASFGLTAGEQASALLQVSQAFNKGKLDGDEFRSVMENFPAFGEAIARAMGLANTGLLFTASKEGKINLDVMRQAMVLLGQAADTQLNKATLTLDQSFTKFGNTLTVIIGIMNSVLGITNTVARAVSSFSDYLSRLINNYQTFKNQTQGEDAARQSFRATEIGFSNQQKQAEDQARAKVVGTGEAILERFKIGGQKANEELTKVKDTINALNKIPADQRTKDEANTLKLLVDNRKQLEQAIDRKDNYHVPKGRSSASTPLTPAEKRETFVDTTGLELDKQINSYGKIASLRAQQQALDEIDIKLNQKRLPLLTEPERASISAKLARIEVIKREHAAQDAVYASAVGPQQKYIDTLTGINNLQKSGAITNEQAAIASRKNTFEYQQAIDPLANFNRQMVQQNALLDLSADKRQAESAVQQHQNSLLAQGRILTQTQTETIRQNVQAFIEKERITRAVDEIEAHSVGRLKELRVEEEALKIARDKGIVSNELYRTRTVQLGTAFANLRLANGFGNFETSIRAGLGRIVAGFTTVNKGISDSFGGLFTNLTDGFANSFGQAIAHGKSLKDSLQDVARNALGELIASLVKLGIQFLVNQVLANTAQAATTTASVAQAAAISAAWAGPAALVSLATSGANSIGASTGMVAVSALSKVLGGFESGGYTGNGGTKQIAGVVHGQEFVTNAAATARNRPVLEAMNRGESIGQAMNIEFNNYGTPQTYQAEMSEGRIRIIARDEARQAVDKHAPSVVAADLNNPNSRVSKSIRNNTNTTRKL